MKVRKVIGELLKRFCPLFLGMVAGNTIKVFGPEITWRVIIMCALGFAMYIGCILSYHE